jgi:type II secretory pathway component PulF
MRRKKGQSILEYVIVLTVIVAAIAVAARTFIAPAITAAFNSSNKTITNATDKFPGN